MEYLRRWVGQLRRWRFQTPSIIETLDATQSLSDELKLSSQRQALAVQKANRLLTENLTPDQLSQYKTTGSFEVVGCHTGKRYRIQPYFRVQELDRRGRPVCQYCFEPAGRLVPSDIALAQKVALETYERQALRIANRFPINPGLVHDGEGQFCGCGICRAEEWVGRVRR